MANNKTEPVPVARSHNDCCIKGEYSENYLRSVSSARKGQSSCKMTSVNIAIMSNYNFDNRNLFMDRVHK